MTVSMGEEMKGVLSWIRLVTLRGGRREREGLLSSSSFCWGSRGSFSAHKVSRETSLACESTRRTHLESVKREREEKRRGGDEGRPRKERDEG